jgi:hypothetical protein
MPCTSLKASFGVVDAMKSDVFAVETNLQGLPGTPGRKKGNNPGEIVPDSEEDHLL